MSSTFDLISINLTCYVYYQASSNTANTRYDDVRSVAVGLMGMITPGSRIPMCGAHHRTWYILMPSPRHSSPKGAISIGHTDGICFACAHGVRQSKTPYQY